MSFNRQKVFDLREYFALIWKRKVLIIIPLLVVTGIGIWGSFRMTPIYESSTVILIKQPKLLTQSLENVVPGGEGNQFLSERRENRLAMIKALIFSSQGLKELISKLSLDQDPWVAKTKTILEKKHLSFAVQEAMMEKMQLDYLKNHFTTELKGENILEIKATSPQPEMAARMAETLAEIFIQRNLQEELSGVKQTTNFSTDQLEYYQKQLQTSENKLRSFKADFLQRTNNDTLGQRERASQLASIIAATNLQIEKLKEQMATLAQQIGEEGLTAAGLLSSSVLDEKQTGLSAQVRQYVDLLTTTSASDVPAITLSQKMEGTLNDVAGEIKKLAGAQIKGDLENLRPEIEQYKLKGIRKDFLEEKNNFLEQSQSELKGSITKQVYGETILKSLEHDVEMNQRIYELFVSQAQGSQISQQMLGVVSENQFQIIEPAKTPVFPIIPNKKKIAMFSALTGLLLGLGAAVLAETLDHSFREVEEVEAFLDLKVLGTVSRIENLGKYLE